MNMPEIGPALGQTVFEDVAVGHDAALVRFGPFTTAHLMRWSAAMENWQLKRSRSLLPTSAGKP